jgi:hypothetical protein
VVIMASHLRLLPLCAWGGKLSAKQWSVVSDQGSVEACGRFRAVRADGGRASCMGLVVSQVPKREGERGGEAGVGKEDFFSGKDGRRNGASRGGGRLLGEASHRRKQDETGNKTEFQSEAVQRKFSLRTNIHSFGAFRQAWTGKEENGGILVQKG